VISQAPDRKTLSRDEPIVTSPSHPEHNREKPIMKIRIAMLFAVAPLIASATAAQSAPKPIDPDHAPIAAVNRFSDSAGTLLRRSADTRLPGPNEPIDFDRPPLNTLGFSPAGEPVLYYHLDVQSTTPAPAYILYREGEDDPVQGQLDIIDTLPGEKGRLPADLEGAGTERLCRQHDYGCCGVAAAWLQNGKDGQTA
jgi:hypothetical protein